MASGAKRKPGRPVKVVVDSGKLFWAGTRLGNHRKVPLCLSLCSSESNASWEEHVAFFTEAYKDTTLLAPTIAAADGDSDDADHWDDDRDYVHTITDGAPGAARALKQHIPASYNINDYVHIR